MGRKGTDSHVIEAIEPPKKKIKNNQAFEFSELDVSIVDDEALPPGLILTDITQKQWRIGKPIGRGSFGRIYLASDDVSREVTRQSARYVVKIEPHSNGPLFVEVHCLIRTGKAKKVVQWRTEKKLKKLGMPLYIASGSHIHKATRHRFLVLPRYEADLQKIITRRGDILDCKNVLVLAVQILDVLEYLHSHGYAHSDIKSSNLMIGFNGSRYAAESLKCVSNIAFQTPVRKSIQHKPAKSSSYYEDKDFVIKDYKSSSYDSSEEDSIDMESPQASYHQSKKKLRRILADRNNRRIHRNHAFNLRQLSTHINYEDLTSSVCSDESYQRLLDEQENKGRTDIYSSDEGFHEESKLVRKLKVSNAMRLPDHVPSDDWFKEAIISQSNGQIYLCDFGLASKFVDSNGNHKEFMMDARKAHDGTLEYSSRDSHVGAHSRRSDLECLGFNLLDWLTGTLPWKTTEMLSEPNLVHALKKNCMQDVKSLLTSCFKTEYYPEFLERYFQYVTNLEFTDKPDYAYCRSIFRNEYLRRNYGNASDMGLGLNNFPTSPAVKKRINYSKRLGRNISKNTSDDFLSRNGVKKIYGRENKLVTFESSLKMDLLRKTLNLSNEGLRKPCTSRNFFISDADLVAKLKQSLLPTLEAPGKKLSPKNLRSKKRIVKRKKGKRSSIGKFGHFLGSGRQFTWAEILAGNPEHIIRKDKGTNTDDEDNQNIKSRNRKISNASDTSNNNPEHSTQSPLMQKDYLNGLNPTYAMKDVFNQFRRKMTGSKTNLRESFDDNASTPHGYTPAMLSVLRSKEKQEAKEKLQEQKEKMGKTKPAAEKKTCTRSQRSSVKTIATKTDQASKGKSLDKAVVLSAVRKSKTLVKDTGKTIVKESVRSSGRCSTSKRSSEESVGHEEVNSKVKTTSPSSKSKSAMSPAEKPKKKTPRRVIRSPVSNRMKTRSKCRTRV